VTVALAPRGGRDGEGRIVLELAAVALFRDERPQHEDEDAPCDAGRDGALVPRAATVGVELGAGEATALGAFALPAGGALEEVWLVLRQATLETAARTYLVHAEQLCRMPDGLQYTLVRVEPDAPVPLRADTAVTLAVPFDAREAVVRDRVDCRGGDRPEECDTSDDAGDDDDPDTRLRYQLEDRLDASVAP
jgi:hypothetical protein